MRNPPLCLLIKKFSNYFIEKHRSPRLYNGTRLQVTNLRNNIIKANILTGLMTSELALISHISIISINLLKRIQFLVKNCFTMTKSKAQGQLFKFIGVNLWNSCFSHGQLNVALSWVGTEKRNQYILLPKSRKCLYPDVLT